MAETLFEYHRPVLAPDGSVYEARACGSPMPGRLWQGWIEFVPAGGGDAVRTARETTQPNRVDVDYWASGVSAVYLQGALRRALAASAPLAADSHREARTLFVTASISAAVVDPYEVFRKGESQLRRQLAVLTARHLVDIAVAYQMTALNRGLLDCLPAATLLEMIVLSVTRGSTCRVRRQRPVRASNWVPAGPSSTTQSGR
jgi:hypothetical protein